MNDEFDRSMLLIELLHFHQAMGEFRERVRTRVVGWRKIGTAVRTAATRSPSQFRNVDFDYGVALPARETNG